MPVLARAWSALKRSMRSFALVAASEDEVVDSAVGPSLEVVEGPAASSGCTSMAVTGFSSSVFSAVARVLRFFAGGISCCLICCGIVVFWYRGRSI